MTEVSDQKGAEIMLLKAQTIAQLVAANFTRESAVKAVTSGDLSVLVSQTAP